MIMNLAISELFFTRARITDGQIIIMIKMGAKETQDVENYATHDEI